MTQKFTEILLKIENELKEALPENSNELWKQNSFGNLSESINKKHLNNLIQPNLDLICLGGKRWRPLLLVLCYEMAKKNTNKNIILDEEIFSLTPLVEFVHTASLIHDDIEDNSDLRRGKPAIHILYGLDSALNSASWLYFEAPVCINNCNIDDKSKLLIYQIYTNELRKLHLGQAMDIFWHRNCDIFPTQDEYFAMVQNKTGTLASLAAKIGCVLGGMNKNDAEQIGQITSKIGIGFQILDDVINLTTGNVGKKRGDDIIEGKKSLPIILHTNEFPKDKEEISRLMKIAAQEGINSSAIEECIKLLNKSDCINKSLKMGVDFIEQNCILLKSQEINDLFSSMIPKI